MSDLDADLYADLYGNDEGDFSEHAQQETDKTDAQDTSAETVPAPAPVPQRAPENATATKTPPQVSVPAPTDTKPYTISLTQTAQAIPVTQAPQIAQQIPTYVERPSDSDYHDQQRPRQDGFVAGGERTVRPSEMKDEGKMFIGGLNWDTTDDSLRNYFSQFGKVDACTIMRDAAGRSRCFAFLTFEDPASVNAVMVREHFLDGKIIDPKRAIPRQEHQRATKLFIGGLAGTVTSESMREFFSQFGKVIDSTVMLDRETGRSKGFGFVSFEDTNVQPFLGFGNLQIDGKLIDVKLAQPRYQRDVYHENQEEFGGAGGGGNGRGGGGFQGGSGGGSGSGAGTNFGGAATAPAGNTPFDPQALATLYTRMLQMTGGGQMNPMMGMNPMMAGGMGMGMGMGRGMGMGMGGGMGGAMGGGMGGAMGGMGRGGPGMGGMGAPGMNPNIPRGPRGAPTGPGAMGAPGTGMGVGPQRAGQRGQHNYHPYAR